MFLSRVESQYCRLYLPKRRAEDAARRELRRRLELIPDEALNGAEEFAK